MMDLTVSELQASKSRSDGTMLDHYIGVAVQLYGEPSTVDVPAA